jgi:hypothetical protein
VARETHNLKIRRFNSVTATNKLMDKAQTDILVSTETEPTPSSIAMEASSADTKTENCIHERVYFGVCSFCGRKVIA